MFKRKNVQKRDNEPSISSSSDIESLETLSLENESFISFKTKPNSTVDLSIKSLTKSKTSKTSVKKKKEYIVNSAKVALRKRQKKLENNFLGYYGLIPGNTELSIPRFFLSTARIDLHEEKTENPAKAKHLVLTKIKESPYIKNTSLFIITGKRKQNENGTGWTGTKFNEFPEWMQDDSIKHLIDGVPLRGLGTYKVLIKKIGNIDIHVYKDIKLKELEENAKKEIGFNYKLTLAGFYMMGVKENYSNTKGLIPESENWYKEAVKWYREAEKLGSIEAKLCLGYIHVIGFNMSCYDPEKAKKLFKEVMNANKKVEQTTVTNKKATEEKATTEKNAATDKNVTEDEKAMKEVTADKGLAEEITANKGAIKEVIANKEAIEEITSGKKATGKVASDKESTEKAASDGEVTTEKTSNIEITKEITSDREVTEETISNKKVIEEITSEKEPEEEITVNKETNQTIANNGIMKEVIADKKAIGETTVDKEAIDEVVLADKGADKIITAMEKTTTDKVATEETNVNNKEANKELARIAMRNIAMIYHNSYVIKPFEWKNFIKISKPNDLTIKRLSQVKLKLAIKWYKESCELEDSQSAYCLGLLYESNDEIKDKNEAEKWFKKAVQFDDDNLYAKAKLGRILVNKKDVDESEKMNGIQMLKYTAEKGLVVGQTFLGEAYERGQITEGKKANFEEAIKLYFKAARQNHGYYSHIAQYRLKELYGLYGSPLIPDDEYIKNIIKLYVKELKYYYDNNEEMLKTIH